MRPSGVALVGDLKSTWLTLNGLANKQSLQSLAKIWLHWLMLLMYL
jgi:hypothetical protein